MGVAAIELLKTIGLLGTNGKPADLSKFDQDTLCKLLDYYGTMRVKQGLKGELYGLSESPLSAVRSPVSTEHWEAPTLASTLIYSRTWCADWLLCHISMWRALGHMLPPLSMISRDLQRFSSSTTLIREGALVVTPLFSAVHARLPDTEELKADPLLRRRVPKTLYEIIHERARVTRQPWPVDDDPTATDLIAVSFEADELGYTEAISWAGELSAAVNGLDMSARVFPGGRDGWEVRAINLAISGRIEHIHSAFHLAMHNNATYVTESAFEAEMCGASTNAAEQRAVQYLRVAMPYLSGASAETVADIRSKQMSLLTRFRSSLLDIADDLSGDPDSFDERAKRHFTNEIEPQIKDIRDSVKSLAASAVSGLSLGAVTIALAIATGRSLPFISTVGAVGATSLAQSLVALRTVQAKKQRPAYIWSQLVK